MAQHTEDEQARRKLAQATCAPYTGISFDCSPGNRKPYRLRIQYTPKATPEYCYGERQHMMKGSYETLEEAIRERDQCWKDWGHPKYAEMDGEPNEEMEEDDSDSDDSSSDEENGVHEYGTFQGRDSDMESISSWSSANVTDSKLSSDEEATPQRPIARKKKAGKHFLDSSDSGSDETKTPRQEASDAVVATQDPEESGKMVEAQHNDTQQGENDRTVTFENGSVANDDDTGLDNEVSGIDPTFSSETAGWTHTRASSAGGTPATNMMVTHTANTGTTAGLDIETALDRVKSGSFATIKDGLQSAAKFSSVTALEEATCHIKAANEEIKQLKLGQATVGDRIDELNNYASELKMESERSRTTAEEMSTRYSGSMHELKTATDKLEAAQLKADELLNRYNSVVSGHSKQAAELLGAKGDNKRLNKLLVAAQDTATTTKGEMDVLQKELHDLKTKIGEKQEHVAKLEAELLSEKQKQIINCGDTSMLKNTISALETRLEEYQGPADHAFNHVGKECARKAQRIVLGHGNTDKWSMRGDEVPTGYRIAVGASVELLDDMWLSVGIGIVITNNAGNYGVIVPGKHQQAPTFTYNVPHGCPRIRLARWPDLSNRQALQRMPKMKTFTTTPTAPPEAPEAEGRVCKKRKRHHTPSPPMGRQPEQHTVRPAVLHEA